MLTLIFSIAILLGVIYLIKIQPVESRTLFDPGVLFLGLFSLTYWAPTIAVFKLGDLTVDLNIVETLSLYGTYLVVFFVVFYVCLTKKFNKKIINSRFFVIKASPKKSFYCFFWCYLFVKFIMWHYGLFDQDDYIGQYAVRANLPISIRQSLNIVKGIELLLVCIVLAVSYSSPSKKNIRYVWYVGLLYLFEMMITNVRSHLVNFVLMVIAARILYVRPIGVLKELTFSFLFIISMGIFSFRRVTASYGESSWVEYLLPSEFIVIHSNAIKLLTDYDAALLIEPPGNSYIQALISFIPKQINPDKWSLADWYVNTYFPEYAKLGGGQSFGIVSEAIVNWGVLSIIFQAFVVALCLSIMYVAAKNNKNGGANFWVICYISSYPLIYQLIRNNSFIIIDGFFLGLVVPFTCIAIVNKIFINYTNNSS